MQAIAVVWYLQDLSKKALQEIDEDFGADDSAKVGDDNNKASEDGSGDDSDAASSASHPMKDKVE